jgi:trehalose-6-phosphate synthase
MKINLTLVISIVFAVGLVAFIFTIFQISEERDTINRDLEKSAFLLTEDFYKSHPKIIGTDRQNLQILFDSLNKDNKYLGMGFYYKRDNSIIPLNSSLQPYLNSSMKFVVQSVKKDSSFGNFVKVGKQRIYQYFRPSHGSIEPFNAIVLYADARFVRQIVQNILFRNFIRWFFQALLVALVTILVIRWGILGPINKIVKWIRDARTGTIDPSDNRPPAGFLAPLHEEIANIAQAMQEARAIAEEEVRLRAIGEAIWTPDRLKEEVKKLLHGKALIVVSNREPYMHIHSGKEIKCIVPASGMVTAMEPILKACGGVWIATGSGDADREMVDKNNKIAVPPDEQNYVLKRVWTTKEEEQHYYYGFSNEGLWPLCHIAHTRPVFREEDWNYYKEVNHKFAKSVVEEIKNIEQPFILVQDYHFALLPEMIKKERKDAKIALFWHIPWPNPESFGICPWQSEIIHGMLGSDLIGFHTQYHCNNFLETVNNSIESRVIWDNFSVKVASQTTLVKPFPISIAFTLKDYDGVDERLLSPDELLNVYGVTAQIMGIGVDRLDYTKGILEKFLAIERFLEKNKSYQGKFTFVQIGAPSRTLLKSYSDLVSAIENEATRINNRFKHKNWKAILLLKRHHGHDEILPFYKAAALCMVTSLHDGMNLVAKEFVAARNKNDGVLILSRFAGATQELQGAIVVNPYDIEKMSDAIKYAIEMPKEDQRQRMRQMRQVIVGHNIFSWAANLLRTMVSIQN